MIGEFRATLYDFFGFLIPGIVALSAGALLWHRLFYAGLIVPSAWPLGKMEWIPFLLAAYLAGHLAQAVANAVPPFNLPADKSGWGSRQVPPELLSLGILRLSSQLGLDVNQLPSAEVWSLIDEVATDSTGTANREVYVYREGFYRGMAVSSALFAIAVASHFGTLVCASRGNHLWCAGGWETVAVFIVSVAAAIGFFLRMRRFASYRIQRSLYRFLLSQSSTTARQE